jgi:hypothetical protein
MLTESPTSFLTVGLPLQLTFPRESLDLHCQAALYGWKARDLLISELPFPRGKALEPDAEEPCIVRYYYDGRMVGYRSHVQAHLLVPEPLLFLSFPSAIEEILLRKHPRVHLDQPLYIYPVAEISSAVQLVREVPLRGLIKDLSVAGCRVEMPGEVEELVEGLLCRLEFELPGIGRIGNLSGVVKNRVRRPHRVQVGLEFQYHQMEYVEYRGWGGTVRRAIEQFVSQRHGVPASPS